MGFKNRGSSVNAGKVHGGMNTTTSYHRNDGEVINTVRGNVTNMNNYKNIHLEEQPICFGYQVPVEDFIGRSVELERLHKAVIDQTKPVVVSGLGGIGKTQIVKKFIEDHKRFYSNLIWIDAEDRGKIEAGFKALARDKLNISLKVMDEEKDFRSLTEKVFSRLSKSSTLVVFDNIDNIEDTEFVLKMETLGITPHIIITSRIQEWDDSVSELKLDVFSFEDALKYVSHKLKRSHEGEEELVEILHNFPIALRQATAHIICRREEDDTYNINDYIKDYNSQRDEILACNYFQKGVLHQYTQTTLTTWKVTMLAINRSDKKKGHLAHRILNIMAYFCSDHICRNIFFKLENSSETDVISAVRILISYSMVDGHEGQNVLSIHRLVQKVIKLELEKDISAEIEVLREGLRLVCEQRESFEDCYWHGISVFLSALKFNELVDHFRFFPNIALDRMIALGNYFRAFDFGTEILSPLATILGEDDQQTLASMYYIACSYHNLGQLSEALQMFQEVYEKQKTIFGENHPNTLISQLGVANIHVYLGQYSRVVELYEEVLEKEKTILGENSPHTLRIKSRIANVYNKLGKHSRALEMFKEVFTIEKVSLGEDHPDTLITKSKIADSYRKLNQHNKALEMYKEVLTIEKANLGEKHPDTLTSRHKVADSYRNLGQHSRALKMYIEVLTIEKVSLGEDHPDTLITKSEIANTLFSKSNMSEAGERHTRKNVRGCSLM